MAIQRLALSDIETAVLQIMGYGASTASPWKTQANFYVRVNEYMQRIPAKISAVSNELRQRGTKLPYNGIPRFDFWRTQGNITTTSGSATAYMPADYDHYISFWDNTNSQPISVVEDVDRYHQELRTESAGPPRHIELLGFATNGSTWVRQATIFPATMSGITPSIRCTYWRIPAKMAGASPAAEYPDIDPKWESIAIYGTVCDLARPIKLELPQYQELEKEMLTEMAMTARGA